MIRVYDKDCDAMVRIKFGDMDLDDYLMKFANDVKHAHDVAMEFIGKAVSNGLQV